MRRFLLTSPIGVILLFTFLQGVRNEDLSRKPLRLVDATLEAGIDFFHHSSPEKKYLVEVMSGGVALFDFDNDGRLDIFLLNSLTVETRRQPEIAESKLYRNRGDGTFEDVTPGSGLAHPGWGMGVIAGDFDSDGWLDLYVTCLGPNRLYRNNRDGTFTDVAAGSGVADSRWSVGASFGDYDGDGDLDLFVANYVDFDLDNLPEFGQGQWCQHRGIPVHCGPKGLPGAGDALFRNEGDGTFSDVSVAAGMHDPDGAYGMAAVWLDVNDDGNPDLFVANDSGPNFLYENQGNGTFTEIGFLSGIAVSEAGLAQGCMGVAVADYDQDGKLDLFVTNFVDEYNVLYRREKPSLFMDSSFASLTAAQSFPLVGWGTEFVDIDNDGWVDLLVVNGHVYPQVDFAQVGSRYAQPKLLYLNQRDGTFIEASNRFGNALQEARPSRGMAAGDLDNDGDIDFVINDLDGPAMVLRNEGGNEGNWVRVVLKGTGKNLFAIGATVQVIAGGGQLKQLLPIRSGTSYASQSDFRLHFGLGSHSSADRITVYWPDGRVTERKDVEANQEITISQQNGTAIR